LFMLLNAAAFVEGYLLVAMPQSSSTSTMVSLGSQACKQAMSSAESAAACRNPLSKQVDPVWTPLVEQQSHVCQLPSKLLLKYSRSNTTVYKDHILPTQASVEALLTAGWPVNVLLRKPASSLHGWCERHLREHFPAATIAKRAPARYAALVAFDREWRQQAAQHPMLFHLSEFEQMEVAGRASAIGKMLAIWRLRSCRSFHDATQRLVNESSAHCAEIVQNATLAIRDGYAGAHLARVGVEEQSSTADAGPVPGASRHGLVDRGHL
jgi:hypothetical protein